MNFRTHHELAVSVLSCWSLVGSRSATQFSLHTLNIPEETTSSLHARIFTMEAYEADQSRRSRKRQMRDLGL
jgi:hypothetical protein